MKSNRNINISSAKAAAKAAAITKSESA